MTFENDGLRILFLEDNRKDIEIIYQRLIDEFDCNISFDAAGTKEEYRNAVNSKQYDVILADYTLPGFNAKEALRYALSACPETPFICVSGTIGEDVAVELIKKGADDYVLKDRIGRLPFAISRALENKKSEQTIRELSSADKNKSVFLNVLSHELRNPLATISAGLELLDVINDAEQIEKTKRILRRQIEHICRLVDDLLDITRISNNKVELKKEKVDLNKIALLVSDENKHFFEQKGIKLITETRDCNCYVEADPSRLSQMISNLLNNALKFTSPEGEVLLSVYKEKNEAVVCVKDNGIGIGTEMLPLIFEPFMQAENSFERDGGLGLGLAITKAIAELHGGRIKAESEGLGKGASFYVRLPLFEEDKERENRIEAISNKTKKRILLIEDNRDYAEILCSTLNAMGYEVASAYDGSEGIKKASEIVPDVVICDIGLPGMNGYEVAENMKKDLRLKGAYLLAITGFTRFSSMKRAVESGFSHCLTKPLDINILKDILSGI